MRFEWDSEKAAENLRKHRVSFDEAASAFFDPLSMTVPDPDHPVESGDSSPSAPPRAEGLSSWHIPSARRPFESSAQDQPAPQSAIAMKPKSSGVAEMRAEYDFSNGVRGRYHKRLVKEGSNVVVLEPDVAKAFPDSASVNEALRVVLKAGRTARRLTTRSSGPEKVVGRNGAPKK